jgi:D-xylonolactonase
MKLVSLECVWPARALLGEGPVWDERVSKLYWVDILNHRIHQYDPEAGDRATWQLDRPVSFVLPAQGGASEFWAGLDVGVARLVLKDNFDCPKYELFCCPETDKANNRLNDGKLAPDGSIWFGTMDSSEQQASGSWWRLGRSGLATKLDDGYSVTNGPVFDAARSVVYLTDSKSRTIYQANLHSGGEGFSQKQIFLSFEEGYGAPDGMCLGPDKNLWVAFWDAACIRIFNPDRTLIGEIELPITRPTSLAFSPDGADVYITSASVGLTVSGG